MAQTLRVMAQENRDMRMSEAEKKAAGLPPKLTVPMILFFLPVLFVVILGPAAIRVDEAALQRAHLRIYVSESSTVQPGAYRASIPTPPAQHAAAQLAGLNGLREGRAITFLS